MAPSLSTFIFGVVSCEPGSEVIGGAARGSAAVKLQQFRL
jgi:hypothetical protein